MLLHSKNEMDENQYYTDLEQKRRDKQRDDQDQLALLQS